MVISNGQIAKMICIACHNPIGDHKRRELWRCLFRVQSSILSAKMEKKLETEDKGEKKSGFRGNPRH